MIFLPKRKIDNFDPYNVFLVIAKYTCATYDCFWGHNYGLQRTIIR